MQSYLSATQVAEAYYNKAEVDSAIDLALQPYLTNIQLTESYYSKAAIDTLLVTNSYDIASTYYDKMHTDNLFTIYATSTQLHNDFYSKAKTNLILEEYYDRAQTDWLLNRKASTTGDSTINGNIAAIQANLTSADTNVLPLVLTRDVNNWFLCDFL